MAILSNKLRLGIPRINPNPLPPNSPFRAALSGRLKPMKAPIANPLRAALPSQNPTSTAQPSNTPTQQSTPTDPYQQAGEIFKPPTYTPETHGPHGKFKDADPRDSTYWSALAKLQFNDQQEYAKTLAEESGENSGFNLATQQAIQNRVVEQRRLGEGLMTNGLTASGYHDRSEAEQNQSYTNARAEAGLSHEQKLQAFQAARQALVQGYGIDSAALLAEAAGRYSAKREGEAENAPGEPTGVTEGVGAGGGKQAGKKGGGNKGGHRKGGGRGNGGTTAPTNYKAPRVRVSQRRKAK